MCSFVTVCKLFLFNNASLLLQVQEWLYTDGEDASASEFKERLDMLKSIGDPIFFRWVTV